MRKEEGNALFLILIAVALFAALSCAITQSGRGGGTVRKEQSTLDAAKIIQYAGSVGQVISRMRLAAGCSETQISFENGSEGGYVNVGAPADKSCHVFNSNGGAAVWQDPPSGSNTDGSPYSFVGGPVVHSRDGANSTGVDINADLVIYLFRVTEEICQAINTGLGISGIPLDGGSIPPAVKFVGTYDKADNINGIVDVPQPSPCIVAPGTGLCGKMSGCFKENMGGQRYIFYNVLISR